MYGFLENIIFKSAAVGCGAVGVTALESAVHLRVIIGQRVGMTAQTAYFVDVITIYHL